MGTGQHDLGTLAAAADFHHINADAVALVDGFAGDLLGGSQNSLGVLALAGQLQNGTAVAGIHTGDDCGQDLMLLAGILVGDHAALSLADALNNDLLGSGGGDTAKILGFHVDADLVAQLGILGIGASLLQGHLGGGVEDFLHNGLDGVHGDGAGLLINVDEHVVQRGALGIALIQRFVGGYQCLRDPVQHVFLLNTLFLFQIFQGFDHLTCHGSFLFLS